MAEAMNTPRPDQFPSLPDFAAAAFLFVQDHGTGMFPDADLEVVDHFYPILIGRETSSVAVTNMSRTRHMILTALRVRQVERVCRDRMLADWAALTDPEAGTAQGSTKAATTTDDQAPEPTTAESAVKLLRAALTLIQDDQDDQQQGGNGGSRVPRQPIPPRFPSGGSHASPDSGNGSKPAANDWKF